MGKSDEIKLLSTRWVTYSVMGTVMMAAGLVTLMEGIVMRIHGDGIATYGVVVGVAVVIFSAGISFIGTSVKYRIYLDRKRKQDNEFHNPGGSHRHRSESSSGHGHGHGHRSRKSSSSHS